MDDWTMWWLETGRDELADLLLQEWDVLGVDIFEDEAKGEYTYEAEQIGSLLREGADRAAVADRLGQLARYLAEGLDATRDQQAADAALAWYASAQPAEPRDL